MRLQPQLSCHSNLYCWCDPSDPSILKPVFENNAPRIGAVDALASNKLAYIGPRQTKSQHCCQVEVAFCSVSCHLESTGPPRALTGLSKRSRAYGTAVVSMCGLQPSTVVADTRRSRSQSPPENAFLDPIRYVGLLPAPFADYSNNLNFNRFVATCPYFLPVDYHTGDAATVLPPPHTAFVSLPTPPNSQLLLSLQSMPFPLLSLPFASESYPSLANQSVAAVLVFADTAVYVLLKSEFRC